MGNCSWAIFKDRSAVELAILFVTSAFVIDGRSAALLTIVSVDVKIALRRVCWCISVSCLYLSATLLFVWLISWYLSIAPLLLLNDQAPQESGSMTLTNINQHCNRNRPNILRVMDLYSESKIMYLLSDDVNDTMRSMWPMWHKIYYVMLSGNCCLYSRSSIPTLLYFYATDANHEHDILPLVVIRRRSSDSW